LTKVHVHVEESRKEKFACAVDPHNVRGRRDGTSGYEGNALSFNQYTDVLSRPPGGAVDEGRILD
jgi:hypothetical protein